MDLLAETKSRAPFTSSIKNFDMSPKELRIRVRALIRPTLGIIEERADRIMAEASDPLVRRGVLVLKIEMSATLLAAMLRSDPVLAFGDTWGYVLQVEDLLKRPEMGGSMACLGKWIRKRSLSSRDGSATSLRMCPVLSPSRCRLP